MARRSLVRTAEGAWYHNYNGYHHINSPANYDRHQSFSFSNREEDRELDPRTAMTEYERNAALAGRPPLYDRHEYQVDRQRPRNVRGNEYFGPVGGAGIRAHEQSYGEEGRTTQRSEWEVEWVPPEKFSPRKTTNDPNYQPEPRRDPPVLPKWDPPEQRDEEPPPPHPPTENATGQGGVEGQDQGQTLASGLDPRLARLDISKSVNNPKKGGGAFLFVRFPLSRGENVHVTAKACIQAKTSDLGGRFVGISRRVYDFGYPPESEEGCAVFQFPSMRNAEVFFHRDKRIRQPDFPPPQGHAEVFAISLQSDPNTMQTFDTFFLSEISLNDGLGEESLNDYVENFKEPFTVLVQEPQFRALPYAAFVTEVNDRKSFRRHFFGSGVLVTLHLFQRPDNLEDIMKDKRYSYLRAVHNSVATEKCSIFTIDRQACP